MYDNFFYKQHELGAIKSAKRYAEICTRYYRPKSVIDIGCGRGAWLTAFKQTGATRLTGVDGSWNSQNDMMDQSIEFHARNLDQSIDFDGQYDLAICVEVAEHLGKSKSYQLVEELVKLAPVIIFGAAFIRQGGQGHINEDYHHNWANLFAVLNFDVFDLFRAEVWEDDNVSWWYQQNTFLYVNRLHPLNLDLKNLGLHPISNHKFMNCVHPYLFAQKKD